VRLKAFIPALLAIIAVAAFPLPPAGAQDSDDGEGQAERKTRRTQAMSEKVYRRLAEAQELTDAEPPDYAAAMAVLNELKALPKLSPYETAQLYQFYGFIYFAQERFRDSIAAYERVLQQPDLPEGVRTNTLYTLAQLHFTTEQWQKAIDLISQWMSIAENPGPEPFVLLASAYYQLERYGEMISPIERAMSIARERGDNVKEQWWLLLRVAYYEQENYRKVKDILEVLVVNWPKKEYWTQLSAMYGELNEEKRQLAAYEAAYDQGLLVKSNELVQLSQLFMQAEVPFKAARVLEKGFAEGKVEKTEQTYRLLSQAWQVAGNDRKAIAPLKSAAERADDGELDIRLANSYLNLGEYDNCIQAANAGIRKGGLRREDTAHEILGMCLFENDKYDQAKAAFRKAARDKRTAARASNWIRFIEKEEERLRQLEESMKLVRRDS